MWHCTKLRKDSGALLNNNNNIAHSGEKKAGLSETELGLCKWKSITAATDFKGFEELNHKCFLFFYLIKKKHQCHFNS